MTSDLMEPRCTATAKQTGERCRNRPVPGGTVCRIHGGGALQVRRKAYERLADRDARRMLRRLGQPEPLGHPVEELLAIAAEARAWLGVLRSRLAQLTSYETAALDGAERERATVVIY